MTTAMDSYGFQLSSLTDAEQGARDLLHARALKLAKKWRGVQTWAPSSASTPISSENLKSCIRQGGIPPNLRPLLWYQLSGGFARQQAAGCGYYDGLISAKQAGIAAETVYKSPFPNHVLLSSKKGLAAVRRVVGAYGLHNPCCGFSQSLGCIAGFLLVVMGFGQEEQVFWTLTALLEDRLFPGYFEDLKGCRVEQHVLEDLLAKKCPRLTQLLARLDTSASQLASDWFLTLFTKVLPAETAARVLDSLFCEGPKVLFRTALALFKANEAWLLAAGHGMQVERVLAWRVARTYDADALMKMAFNGIGSLSMSVINKARSGKECHVQAQVTAHKRRLEALVAVPPRHRACGGLASIMESPTELCV